MEQILTILNGQKNQEYNTRNTTQYKEKPEVMIYPKKEIPFMMEELKKIRNDRRRETTVEPRRSRFPKIGIKLNEDIITSKDQMRYLGVILDRKNI
ncbi:hypothetical protein GWI33_011629 [Rhynchophorus ferrugineus]|uniref:Uncharacterized protein n=1 Tax=Rhynchophorus ferrugineus TaxID=354439 RepID=A0A834IAN1_RHYFE|nr:hypothetical protein GWI33_011629 [Rhynchophorus ferrugineus]